MNSDAKAAVLVIPCQDGKKRVQLTVSNSIESMAFCLVMEADTARRLGHAFLTSAAGAESKIDVATTIPNTARA